MSEEHICMGCMQAQDHKNTGPCQECGFDEAFYLQQPAVTEGVFLPLGTRLRNGRYITGKVLGHGAIGVTYTGYDTTNKTRVAFKEYLPRILANRTTAGLNVITYGDNDHMAYQKGLEEFLEEAQVLAQLNNISGMASVIDWFRENQTGYLVRQYLDGFSLGYYLSRLGRMLDWQEALLFITPVLDSLQEIHAAGLIHCNISPDNVFVCDDGNIRLIDIATARMAFRDYARNISVVLKPGYAALEQYRRQANHGTYTDVYGAAALLYRMASGGTAPPASERCEGDRLPNMMERIPEAFHPVMLKAMALTIEERYQTIESFREGLQIPDFPAEKRPPDAALHVKEPRLSLALDDRNEAEAVTPSGAIEGNAVPADIGWPVPERSFQETASLLEAVGGVGSGSTMGTGLETVADISAKTVEGPPPGAIQAGTGFTNEFYREPEGTEQAPNNKQVAQKVTKADMPHPWEPDLAAVADDDDDNGLLPPGYEAVLNSLRNGSDNIGNQGTGTARVYKKRKATLGLVIILVTILGLGAGYFFYLRFPNEVSGLVNWSMTIIERYKFW